ncbi:hypothetical protein GQ43DRAFT_343013, partial [Delitschia confertaspora ATCC 74209]
IHPLLRQRMLNRAATISEGARPSPPRPRTGSVISDLSESRYSFRSSTDNLLRAGKDDMNTLTSSEEPSVWDSLPLAFAILPAIGGLLFQNGSSVVTDMLLLGLGSMFLNWCVRAPWDWYHAAQRIRYASEGPERFDDITIAEEDGEGYAETREGSSTATPVDQPKRSHTTDSHLMDAEVELASNELWALLMCFIGPLLGAYLLHTLRSQLTRPAEGLVSNYNLTIFVMAAELRPVSHVIKMKQARMLYLQRVVKPDFDSDPSLSKSETEDLSKRLADVEARLIEPAGGKSDMSANEISVSVRQSLQPQLDALNRAVRRYEKRQAAQAIQLESRFADLELRMKDALSLAAAAARTGQRPGAIAMLLRWITNCITYWTETIGAVVTYPFRLAATIFGGAKSVVATRERSPKARMKATGTGYPSLSTPRMQSKSGR